MNRIHLAGLVTAGALLLAACASGSNDNASHAGRSMMSSGTPGASMTATGTPPPTGTPSSAGTPATALHNAADVSFATDMIPHHAQAITMADMATARASTSPLKHLAAKIKTAQTPEITQMSGWLAGWKQPIPASTYTVGSMGGRPMRGMMSDQDMTALSHVTSSGFDRMWLTMMISHHQGALGMAKTELSQGQNADPRKLAHSIVTSHSAEIVTMKRMLADLPS